MDSILNNIDVVIYHKNCPDGIGSATVVYHYYLKFPEKLKNIEFIPCSHGEEPPSNLYDKNVLICDFSFNNIVTKELIKITKNLLILDHHITAFDELKDIPEHNKVFDIKRSGAMITWDTFFNHKDPPFLIEYIQDYDLWNKKLDYINEFSSWFHELPRDIDTYIAYFDNDKFMHDLLNYGKMFLALKKKKIIDYSSYAGVYLVSINDVWYLIAQVNSQDYRSEIGNYLCNQFSLIDFSVGYTYSDKSNQYFVSFRSLPHKQDVSAISLHFKGGGHKCASGATFSKFPFYDYEINITMIYNKLNILISQNKLTIDELNNVTDGLFNKQNSKIIIDYFTKKYLC
jgi:uncharacterized protein